MKQPMAKGALAALAFLFAALCLTLMPAPARAVEVEPNVYEMHVISSCPECNGAAHTGWDGCVIRESDISQWSGAEFRGSIEQVYTTDPSIVGAMQSVTGDGEPCLALVGEGVGTAIITVQSSEGDEITFSASVVDISDDFTQVSSELQELIKTLHTSGELTSFEIANGDISLDGIDAYQVRVPSTSLIWETNPDASFDVISVAVDNPEVASVYSRADETTGKTTWSIGPGIVGGTTTLTAVAVDSNNPANKFEDKVTVTCTPGEGWTRVPDLSLGENGVLTVPMGWAEHGGFGLFDWDFWSTIYCDSTITVADDSIAEGDSLGRSIIPKKPGTTTVTLTIDDLYYGGTKTVTAQLVVTEGDAVTTLTNEQGASLSHVAQMVSNGFGGSYSDDNTWRNLDLVTEWLGGDAAAAAGDAVNAAISDVNSMYVYDIHLEEYGQVFEIPEGDSVTVTLPLPDDMGTDGVHVYHVADDGTVTDMGATVDAEARTVTFTTTHFSTFVIAQVGSTTTTQAAGQKAEPAGEKSDGSQAPVSGIPATGDPGCVAVALATGSGAVALLGSRILRRRR